MYPSTAQRSLQQPPELPSASDTKDQSSDVVAAQSQLPALQRLTKYEQFAAALQGRLQEAQDSRAVVTEAVNTRREATGASTTKQLSLRQAVDAARTHNNRVLLAVANYIG